MDTRGLSLEQGPPLRVPFAHFLTAPLFGVVGAVMLARAPVGSFVSRWSPDALAMMHIYALGFLVTIMMGALFQVLPVVAGRSVARAGSVAAVTLPLHVLGTAGLAYGLSTYDWRVAIVLVALLVLGLIVFLAATAHALWSTSARGESVTGLRWTLVGLLLTLLLGASLSLGHRGVPLPFMRPDLTNLHAAASLGAFTLGLIASVAYQVVPMFYVTPSYPRVMRGAFVPATVVLSLLCALCVSLGVWRDVPLLRASVVLMVLPVAMFCVVTLRLLALRKRKVPEVSVTFWRLGLSLALASAVASVFATVDVLPATWPTSVVAGALALSAVAAIVTGMLLRIVPFLVWFHLQAAWSSRLQQEPARVDLLAFTAPALKDIVSDAAARWVLRTFVLATVALLVAFGGVGVLAPWAALPLGGYFAALLFVIARAAWLYRRAGRTLAARG